MNTLSLSIFAVVSALVIPSTISVIPASAQTANQKGMNNLFKAVQRDGKSDQFAPQQNQNNQPVQVSPGQLAPNQLPPKTKIIPKNFVQNAGPTGKSIKAKIGQMVMVGFRGTTPNHRGVKAVMQELREGSIGGVMLMKHNVISIRQVRTLTTALRQAARAGGQMPPFISVDQEGGRVQRLKFNRYPSAIKIARSSQKNAARVYGKLACEVRSAGINVNFGPVVDVDIQGRANPIIGRMGRSYSQNPKTVAKYARQFILAHKRYGLMTAAKHFPGHGSSLSDSHKGFTAIPHWNRDAELAPFKQLASGGPAKSVDMVMVGHLFNRSWGAPASLSHRAIAGMLRKQVGFKGVAITDDMEMGAIRKNYKWSTAVKLAVNAGNDVLLYSNTAKYTPFLGRKIRDTIARSICSASNTSKSCVPARAIANAYNRIERLKHNARRNNAYRNAGRCTSDQTRNVRAVSKRKALVR